MVAVSSPKTLQHPENTCRQNPIQVERAGLMARSASARFLAITTIGGLILLATVCWFPNAPAVVAVIASEQEQPTGKTVVVEETVGVLTFAYLWQAHVGLGTLADAKVKGAYTDDTAVTILGTMLRLAVLSEEQFKKLEKSGELTGDDIAVVTASAEISGLIVKQAKALEKLFTKGGDRYAREYESLRKETLAKMEATFPGISDKAGENAKSENTKKK